MKSRREDKLGLLEPPGNGRGFRLHVVDILDAAFEEIGKVAVKILAIGVVPDQLKRDTKC